MRQETLPSPGIVANSIKLRTEAAKAISAVEISAGFGAGKSTHAKRLSDFFTACAAAVADFLDVTVPTVLSRIISASEANKVYILHSEALDPTSAPLVADFTLATPAKTISKVEIDGPYVILTVTVPYTGADDTATVTYNADTLKDLSGNLVADYATQAIVNNLA